MDDAPSNPTHYFLEHRLPPHTAAGRIHMAPLVAAGHHLPISITVLDQEGMDFLFGLDNLKRHQVRRRGKG